jgi:hypothetical protein
MLKKGDKVEYEGVRTVCESDEFKFLGDGPLVVNLEGFDGWVNVNSVKKRVKRTIDDILNKIKWANEDDSNYDEWLDHEDIECLVETLEGINSNYMKRCEQLHQADEYIKRLEQQNHAMQKIIKDPDRFPPISREKKFS